MPSFLKTPRTEELEEEVDEVCEDEDAAEAEAGVDERSRADLCRELSNCSAASSFGRGSSASMRTPTKL